MSLSNLSFWKNVLSSHSSTKFTSEVRDNIPDAIVSPTDSDATPATTTFELKKIDFFLKSYFGNPPHTPILSPNFYSTPSDNQIVLYVCHNKEIVGSIRYKYAGEFEKETINSIDCFCIHPEWRKKGIGTYLLYVLHKITMKKGFKYSIFLKESSQISSSKSPLYSSNYAFSKIVCTESPTEFKILSISHELAKKLIEQYLKIYPDTFILINKKDKEPNNIEWRFFKESGHVILACFQNSYQIHPENNGKIGWCTGWLETSHKTKDRHKIINAMLHTLPYDWVWADARWIGSPLPEGWKYDGSFHWYTYQWSTNITLNNYILCV
jgi:N-acetylglutamate synthase-like GNAT family acetyltransferase